MSHGLNRSLLETDPEIAQAIAEETARLSDGLEMIASENYASRAVMEAAGSVMTNKYAEGYPAGGTTVGVNLLTLPSGWLLSAPSNFWALSMSTSSLTLGRRRTWQCFWPSSSPVTPF